MKIFNISIDIKKILNQQELPTITDCQFLRIGFINHQILLQ